MNDQEKQRKEGFGSVEEIIDDTQSKIPVLGDIPVLGFLFKSRGSNKRKQNLMIFLKPSILRDFDDAAVVTNEKYNYLRAEQIRDEDEDFGLIKGAPVLPPLESQTPNQADVVNHSVPAKADKAPAKSSEPEEDDGTGGMTGA